MEEIIHDIADERQGKCRTWQNEKQVFLIRKITRDKVAATSDFLGVSESFVIKVMDLIEENPDLDDEEIAEMLVDF